LRFEMEGAAHKEQLLRRIIREIAGERGVLVAFSGGVDSSLLLWESVQALGIENVTAVTATSPTSLPEEVESGARFVKEIGVKHMIVPSGECSDSRFMHNPEDRCYICKRIRYRLLIDLAENTRGAVVFDGTQADDDPADRPGMRALKELGVATPLADAGLGKEDVRELLRQSGFAEIAKKNAEPCLATRVPTGTPITLETLERVRNGEQFLKGCGLETIRLRDHFPVARIVTDRNGMADIAGNVGLRERICDRLRQLGYQRITLDLDEYGKGKT
jgi:uncharacterized protein